MQLNPGYMTAIKKSLSSCVLKQIQFSILVIPMPGEIIKKKNMKSLIEKNGR